MNELSVVVNQQAGSIAFNFEEVKQQVLEMTSKYTGIVITEEQVTLAKKDRAMLNSKFKELDTRRKEIKNSFMEPFNAFESKVKEIGSIINDASECIDKQIKAFEEAEREKKKAKVLEIYNQTVTNYQEYIPFEKIFNPSWVNVNTTIKSITEDIQSIYDGTSLAVTTIKGMNTEIENEVLDQYKNDLSLGNAISKINAHEKIKAEILAREQKKQMEEAERKQRETEERIRQDERNRVAEEERIRAEERKKIEAEQVKKSNDISEIINNTPDPFVEIKIDDEEAFLTSEEPFITEPAFVTDAIYSVTYEISGNALAFDLLEMYLIENGFDFKKINERMV